MYVRPLGVRFMVQEARAKMPVCAALSSEREDLRTDYPLSSTKWSVKSQAHAQSAYRGERAAVCAC